MQSEVSVLPLYDGMPDYKTSIEAFGAAGFDLSGLFPVVLDQALRVVEFDCVAVSRHQHRPDQPRPEHAFLHALTPPLLSRRMRPGVTAPLEASIMRPVHPSLSTKSEICVLSKHTVISFDARSD